MSASGSRLPDQAYAVAWADYRKRRLLTYLVPGIFLLGSLEGDKIAKQLPLVLFAAALLLYGVLNRWYEAWPCPRCREKFKEKRTPAGEPACSRCGLVKWALSGQTGL